MSRSATHRAICRGALSVALAFSAWAAPALAGILYVNLDSQGTTANQNVFGAVVSGTAVTWPSRNNVPYRDYQFRVSVTSGTAILDSFGIQLSANLRQQTSSTTTLMGTLWSGTIPTIPAGTTTTPLYSSRLLSVTTSNTSFNTTSYQTAILGTGTLVPQLITSTPVTYFMRIWSEGNQSNFGFQTKMADNVGEIKVNSDFGATVQVLDLSGTGYAAPAGQFQPVPEPAGFLFSAAAAVLSAPCAAWVMRRRRRAG